MVGRTLLQRTNVELKLIAVIVSYSSAGHDANSPALAMPAHSANAVMSSPFFVQSSYSVFAPPGLPRSPTTTSHSTSGHSFFTSAANVESNCFLRAVSTSVFGFLRAISSASWLPIPDDAPVSSTVCP